MEVCTQNLKPIFCSKCSTQRKQFLRFQFLDFSIYSQANLTEPFLLSPLLSGGHSHPSMLKDYLGNNNRVLFFQFEMFGFLLLFFKKMLFLAIPRPSLGDSRGDRLTKRMLITAIFYNFDPKIIGKCFFIFPKF